MTTSNGPSGALFAIFDVERRLILSSAGLHAFAGPVPEGMVGTEWLHLLHPDDLDYARDLFRRAFGERRSFAGWWRIRRHDDVFVWAMVDGTPMSSQLSDAPMAYMVAVDPLTQLDAFPHAGGLIGPGSEVDGDPHSRLSRIERLADMALMASALARQAGEAAIAEAFDLPLERIGFTLAQLTEPSPPPPREAVVVSQGYRRQARVARRRLAARG